MDIVILDKNNVQKDHRSSAHKKNALKSRESDTKPLEMLPNKF